MQLRRFTSDPIDLRSYLVHRKLHQADGCKDPPPRKKHSQHRPTHFADASIRRAEPQGRQVYHEGQTEQIVSRFNHRWILERKSLIGS